MLQFLEMGRGLYVLAAVCLLGIMGKLLTRGIYKRLMKETGNLVMTKNKNLKNLKQRVESTYRINSGINQMPVYLERQLYDFRFMGVRLSSWANFSSQMTLLCLILGGGAAFLAYWYRMDTYYVVLYGFMGIMTGLLTMFVDNGVNLSEKREQLLIALQDQLENSVFVRGGKGRLENSDVEAEESMEEHGRQILRDKEREPLRGERKSSLEVKRGLRGVRREVAAVQAEEGNSRREMVSVQPEERSLRREAVPVQSEERSLRREAVLSQSEERPVRRDVDFLKQSLEQIAASRERPQTGEGRLPELEPEEIKLIGEIIREYLA